MNLLILVIAIFFILGIFNPKASLFWYYKERTRGLSAIVYGGALILCVYLNLSDTKEITTTGSNTLMSTKTATPQIDTSVAQSAVDNAQQLEENRIKEKLKSKAQEDWPNDYTTQEYWINQELEDYKYMLTITDGPIKSQAERDWPYDFTTQKYWYNQQIAAKERLAH